MFREKKGGNSSSDGTCATSTANMLRTICEEHRALAFARVEDENTRVNRLQQLNLSCIKSDASKHLKYGDGHDPIG